MTGATHVTRNGAECVDLAALEPRNPHRRRLGGRSGEQEFRLCRFGPRSLEWVNAGNLRPLRRLAEPSVWAPLLALAVAHERPAAPRRQARRA